MGFFDLFSKNYLHARAIKIFNEGIALEKEGDYAAAIDKLSYSLVLLQKAKIKPAKKNELMVYVLSIISGVRKKMGLFVLAEQDLQKALALSPDYEGTYFSLGSLQLDQNQFEKGIPFFEKMIELAPKNPDAYFFRAVCLMELRRYKEAITGFEKVLEVGPNDEDVIFNIAWCYEQIKEYDAAIQFYDKLVLMNDKNNKALVNRGNCKIELGLKTDACRDFRAALELGDPLVQENIDEHCK